MQQANQPGKLKTNIELTIQTTIAQNILKGKRKGPVGIVRFNSLITPIWQASGKDNPYADLFFLKLYGMIRLLQKDIQTLYDEYGNNLSLTDGVEINIAKSQAPLKMTLQFNNPYSYRVAYLIVEFENLARLLLSLKYLGVVQGKAVNKALSTCRFKLLRILSKPLHWKMMDVTRADLQLETEKGREAVKLLGEVDGRVLRGELVPPFVGRVIE